MVSPVTILTLTPELRDYAVAIVAVGGLSSAWLAGAVHGRYLAGRPGAYLPCYAVLMALLCAVAALVVVPAVRLPSSGALLASVPAGIAGGALVVWAERQLRQLLRRSAQHRAERRVAPPPPRAEMRRTVGLRGSAALVRPDMASGGASATTLRALLIVVAILEELIFRGVLLYLALHVPLIGAGVVVLLTLTFALTHVQFGWTEVACKLPLGAVSTTIALATGSVLGAVLCHVVVNVRATR